ncbi:hypothetical protein HanPI659440_Chr01g0021331 [Helianthus annuus]|nr:hypothetical protein HanPI659440_Chr01g0021331 [Helianthus annuus]
MLELGYIGMQSLLNILTVHIRIGVVIATRIDILPLYAPSVTKTLDDCVLRIHSQNSNPKGPCKKAKRVLLVTNTRI